MTATATRRPQVRAAATRRRRVAVAAAIAALVAIVVAAIAAIAVGLGPGEPPPATGAAAIVPGDALAYVHVSTDPSRPAVMQALMLAARFPDYPLLDTAVSSRIAAIAGGGANIDFSTEIRPWLGKEAALAVLNTNTSTAGSLIVLDVSKPALARAFVARSGAQSDGGYGGVQLLRYRFGTELAFVKHYLAFGQPASVRGAIDAAAGRTQSLQASSSYRQASGGEPPDRVIDGYASAAGLRRVVQARGGLLGALGVLLYQLALLGTTISLSPASGGARIRLHSALDPKLAHLGGSRGRAFEPSLQSVIPAGTTLLLDVAGLGRAGPRILGAGAAAGLLGRVGPLLSRLATALSSEGVSVANIVSIFGGETAVALVPSSGSASGAVSATGGGSPTASGSATGARSQTLVLVTRTADEARAQTELAALEAPLAQLFPAPSSGPGLAPEFNDRQVGGVTTHQLVLAPGLQVDYAVFDGLVVVSTSVNGIAGVASHAHALSNEPSYRIALAARPQRLTSLLFLDFNQLLSLGEQTGLTRTAH